MQYTDNPTETVSFLVSAQLSDFTSISPSVSKFAVHVKDPTSSKKLSVIELR